MIEGRPRESLVQYENPIEIHGSDQNDPFNKIGRNKQNSLAPLEAVPSSEDILNAILPPREWVEAGKHYI